MHESTRRMLCRIGFLLVCLLPMAGSVGWVVVRHSRFYRDWSRQRLQATLTERLGVTVVCEDLAWPARRTTRLHRVRLHDPETGAELATARLVDVAVQGNSVAIVAAQPELHGRQLGRLWDVLDQRLLRVAGMPVVRFAAGEVHLRDKDRVVRTLSDVRLAAEPSPDGPEATCEFRVAGLTMPAPLSFRALRRRGPQGAVSAWELNTHEGSLPCELLAEFVPAVANLGEHCDFRGFVSAAREPAGWTGQLTGRFRRVDLDRFVTQHFRHLELRGEAEVTLNRASFTSGRLTDFAGTIDVAGGAISQSLVVSLADELGLVAAKRVREPGQSLFRFTRLAVGLQVDAAGLVLTGRCSDQEPGTMLEDAYGRLLGDVTTRPIPAVGLVRALSPDSLVQVPATQETDTLLRWLPLPPYVPVPSSDVPYPRVRLQANARP